MVPDDKRKPVQELAPPSAILTNSLTLDNSTLLHFHIVTCPYCDKELKSIYTFADYFMWR